jgi:hypothetical protein
LAVDLEKVITLERANYEATVPIIASMPGTDLELRDNVILTRSVVLPAPDTNHACLLRSSPDKANDLIVQVIDYYQSKELPATVFVSSACTPDDLPRRLIQHGFVQQETEAWLVYENVASATIPQLATDIPVKPISKTEGPIFVDAFMKSFELPSELAESLVQMIEPSVGLPGVYHYLAYLDDEPVGTYSLICHNGFGILGSAGVIPNKRGKRIIFNLTVEAGRQAKENGVNTLVLQTTTGFLLERLLRIYGFKKAFSRTSYTLT